MTERRDRRGWHPPSFVAGAFVAGALTFAALRMVEESRHEPPRAPATAETARPEAASRPAAAATAEPPPRRAADGAEVVVLRARLREAEQSLARSERERTASLEAARRYLEGLGRAVSTLNQDRPPGAFPSEAEAPAARSDADGASDAAPRPVAETPTWTVVSGGYEVSGVVWNPGAQAVAGAVHLELSRDGEVIAGAHALVVVDGGTRAAYAATIPAMVGAGDVVVRAHWRG